MHRLVDILIPKAKKKKIVILILYKQEAMIAAKHVDFIPSQQMINVTESIIGSRHSRMDQVKLVGDRL